MNSSDLHDYCLEIATRAKRASAGLAVASGSKAEMAPRVQQTAGRADAALLAANQQDLDAAPGFGLTEAAVDRLRLTAPRIAAMAAALEEIAALAEPVGEIISSSIRPNGLEVQKVRVPLGVIFFIYESRPNVTADAAAICVKSGNAVILRGGKEAAHSNRAIVDLLRGPPPMPACRPTPCSMSARPIGTPSDTCSHAGADRPGHSPRRRSPHPPRGGEARMPVIKHFAGNCHVYIDRAADLEMAVRITVNAKCQRLGVCNAAESLLIHADVAEPLSAGHRQGPHRARHRNSRRRARRAICFPPPSRLPKRTTSRNILAR